MFDTVLNTIATITPERPWGIDEPNYFWFTGCSTAAFVIASFSLVFGMKQYKPIAGFSLLVAFALLIAAPLNLVDALQQPGRILIFFMYGWENFLTSPIKWGVLLLMSYFVLLPIGIILFYRECFVKLYNTTNNKFLKIIYKILSLGRMNLNEKTKKQDYILVLLVVVAGIPLALCVHGYTGYILGATHAIALWHTPLMPILFLVSAMVSGIGLLIVILPIFQRFFTEFKQIDKEMISRLARLMSWFIVADLVVRFLWLTFAITFNGNERYSVMKIFESNLNHIIWFEYIISLLIPMAIGFIPSLCKRLPVVIFGAIISTIGVWYFRWNIVIGGESLGRTTPGLLSYESNIFGENSIMAVTSNWAIFIALLCLIMALFPWDQEMEKYYSKRVDNAKK